MKTSAMVDLVIQCFKSVIIVIRRLENSRRNGGICFYLARWIFDLVSVYLHLFVNFSAGEVVLEMAHLV